MMSFWKKLISRATHAASSSSQQLGLGIEALPASLVIFPPSHVGVLLAQDASLRCRLALQAASASLLRGNRLAIVLGADEGECLDRHFEAFPEVQQAVAEGRINLIQCVPSNGAKVRLSAVLWELAWFGVKDEDAVIFLGTDHLFSWGKPARLSREVGFLGHWAEQRPAGSLFLFAGIEGGAQVLSSMARDFPDFGKLLSDEGHVTLEVLRWAGEVAGRSYGLKPGLDGRLAVDGAVVDLENNLLLAASEQGRVLAVAAALPENRGVPETWEIVADLDALLSESAALGGATVLLSYGGREEFLALARVVHGLRRANPRSLKIFVRETGAKLRYGAEAILLQLGANAVLYREVGLSRVIQHVLGSANQIFSRKVNLDIESTLAAAEPEPVAGYLSPSEFCSHVSRMVTRSSELGLDHCLVRFTLLSRVTHLDALQACRAARFGDLVTADREHLYLFLFACREPDLEATLAHIFSQPVETLFDASYINPTSELVMSAVEHLRRQAERESMPDYSGLLAPVVLERPEPVPLTTNTGVALTNAVTQLPAVATVTWPLPRTVVKLPLHISSASRLS